MTRKKQVKKRVKRQAKKRVKKIKKAEKAWGLEFNVFNRGIRNHLDIDYVEKLNSAEKQFLDKFLQSYYNNVFPRKSKPGPKTNMFDKAGIARKELFDQTNARNRDVHARQYAVYDYEKTPGNEDLDSIFDVVRMDDRNIVEDANIEYLDFKRLIERYMKKGMKEEKARKAALLSLGIVE